MNIKTKMLLAGALLASTSVVATVAQAGTTGNIGATSNYIWRGVTQSNDQAAVSGGVDWDHDSGAYAGGWTSSLGGGQYELDVYGGYAFDTGAFSHDVGGIFYLYPVGAAEFDTCIPAAVDPVNVTMSTSGCSLSVAPISRPLP